MTTLERKARKANIRYYYIDNECKYPILETASGKIRCKSKAAALRLIAVIKSSDSIKYLVAKGFYSHSEGEKKMSEMVAGIGAKESDYNRV
jgi:hypothetical protein